MAGVHSGALKQYNCDMCERTPALLKMWGCLTEATQPMEEIEGGEKIVYMNCPLKFIPRSIVQFMRIYSYQKRFPSAGMPAFEGVSSRFLKAVNYYEGKLAEFKKDS